MMRTQRPAVGQAAEYYFTYIDKVADGDVLEQLEGQIVETRALLAPIDDRQGDFRYADGKWSVKQVLGHLADTERVFAYRALAFARGDRQPIPGMDQDRWIETARFDELPLAAIVSDLVAIRAATVTLFGSFSEDQWRRRGTASGFEFEAGAIAWIIAGHELHHRGVLQELYGVGA